MPYDRKPLHYGSKTMPPSAAAAPQQPSPPSAAPTDPEPEHEHEAALARGRAFAAAYPRLLEIENYPREAFAGPLRRFGAFLIDCIVVMPTALLIAWLFGALPGQEGAVFGIDHHLAKLGSKIVQVALYDFYFVSMVHAWGHSWGAKIARFSIVRRNLGKPGKGMARGRYWGTFLSTVPLGLGFLWILGQKHRRAWHDLMAGSYAVKHTHLIRELALVADTPGGETAQKRKDKSASEMGAILLTVLLFAPGLAVLGLCVLVAKKLGLRKPGATEMPASLAAMRG